MPDIKLKREIVQMVIAAQSAIHQISSQRPPDQAERSTRRSKFAGASGQSFASPPALQAKKLIRHATWKPLGLPRGQGPSQAWELGHGEETGWR
jgi:hypothetical protein